MDVTEWTGDELIEALKRCHRTDAPIYFASGDADLQLEDVSTNGGEIRCTFNDSTKVLKDALGDALNELQRIAGMDTQPDTTLIDRLQAVLDAHGG